MQDREQPPKPVHVPESKICPFISSSDNLVECLRERCGIWMINECAVVRIGKGRTGF